MNTAQLPITRHLTSAYVFSLVVAFLMSAASLAGLLFQSGIYPTDDLRHSFVPTDVVNLLIGLPILLGSMALAQRGRLIGLLFWLGALLYVTYHYIAYAVAAPSIWQSMFYLALVVLSVYTMLVLLSSMNSAAIQQGLMGTVPERLAGGVLVGFGLLFFLWNIGLVVQALIGQAALAGPELAVTVADLLIIPAWVIGGVLLWRRQALGYVTGAGLLFQASMLFIGLLVFFVLQPVLTASPFPLEDFVVILVMGLVCFVPFGLFVRGALSGGSRV
jgi:hypothetical protein